MSVTDDLLREITWEWQLRGEWTFAFKDDLLVRAADEYDRLAADHPDREWLTMLALVVLGLVPAGTFVSRFPELRGDQ